MTTEDFMRMPLWQKSQSLAVSIIRVVSDLPRDRSAEAVANQIVRSAGSIAANIAEGYGRYSQAAYRNHLSIARGSLFETMSWLDLLLQSGFISPDVCKPLTRLLQGSRSIANPANEVTGRGQANLRPRGKAAL